MSYESENAQNFAQFRKKLEELKADLDESARRVVSQMADVGLSTAIKNTPVKSGYLRRSWLKSHTFKLGKDWQSGYANSVEYGLYVNNGHRIVVKDKTVGYVKGVRMLEKGMDEARRKNESLFNAEIQRIKQKGGW